jgi:aldose 1-epimerase
MYSAERAFTYEGREAKLITIKNRNDMEVRLLSYGATIAELMVPDRSGNMENVVLTHENYSDYIKNTPYFGATVGRTSGRIGKGSFILDGKAYTLPVNSGTNNLHGGVRGFSYRFWDCKITEEEGRTSVEFSYLSRDMEQGYPGNLDAKVIYSLTDDNELHIEYKALSDKKTLCNLTNHSYFNLSGNYKRKVTEQYLRVKSDKYLELNSSQIPTGKLTDVSDTPMDFREQKLIGRDIDREYEQLILTKGYDHPWLLSAEEEQIEMYDRESGRKMTVSTTYPCVVIYSYNFVGNEKLKYGKSASRHDGICFEAQYEPDGINHAGLNPAVLAAGTEYYEKTVFKFTVL